MALDTIQSRPPPPPPPPPKVEAKPAATPPADGSPPAKAPADPAVQSATRQVAQAGDVAAKKRAEAAVVAPSTVPARGLGGPQGAALSPPNPAPSPGVNGPTATAGAAPEASTPAASFVERAAEIKDPAARNQFIAKVAKSAGIASPMMTGTATLMPGPVDKNATLAGNLATQLQAARTANAPAKTAEAEKRIRDLFGDTAIPKFDAALKTADAAGPRPEHFSPSNGFSAGDPHSNALRDALKPVAAEALLERRLGTQAAELNAAYAKMPATEKAALDAEVKATEEKKGFLDGATQALKDTGGDVAAAAKLAFDLATDPAAREKFGNDVAALTAALKDPAQREAVLKEIGTQLGQGVVDAVKNFSENPAYNAGYLAATVAAGGAAGKALSVIGKAAKIGKIADAAADIARRTKIEVPGPNQLNMGAPFKARILRKTPDNLASPADLVSDLKPKQLRAANQQSVDNPRAFTKDTGGDFFKKGAHVHVKSDKGTAIEIRLSGNKNGGIDFDNAPVKGQNPSEKELFNAENAVRNRLANDRGFRDKLRAELTSAIESASQKTTEQGQIPGAKRLLEILNRIDGL